MEKLTDSFSKISIPDGVDKPDFIKNVIVEMISEGRLLVGEKMPSQRALANVAQVGEHIIKACYQRLIAEGLLIAHGGAGTFINHVSLSRDLNDDTCFGKKAPIPLRKKNPPKCKVDFLVVGLDRLDPYHYPETEMNHYRHLFRPLYKDISQAELVGEIKGNLYVEAVRYYLNNYRSFRINTSNIHIARSRHSSLKFAFSAILSRGDLVMNTAHENAELTDVLNLLGLKSHSINVDEPGFIERLEKALKILPIKALYVQPQCSYPKGLMMTKGAGKRLIKLAEKYKFYIIEEDENHEFNYGRQYYRPLACQPHNGWVIYIGLLSQISLYMYNTRIVAGSWEIIEKIKANTCEYEHRDLLEERCIAQMIRNGDLIRLSKKVTQIKRDARDHLFIQLDNYLSEYVKITKPECGLAFWLEFPQIPGLAEAMKHLADQGIKIPYHPDMANVEATCKFMRLCFGTLNYAEAEVAAKMLQQLFKNLLGR